MARRPIPKLESRSGRFRSARKPCPDQDAAPWESGRWGLQSDSAGFGHPESKPGRSASKPAGAEFGTIYGGKAVPISDAAFKVPQPGAKVPIWRAGEAACFLGVMMRRIAVAAMMIVLLTVSAAHAQSEDPKAQQRRDAKQIDEQYERTRKASSWSTSPKPMNDPWQTVKSPPAPSEKK
jgi:hypothetical protein